MPNEVANIEKDFRFQIRDFVGVVVRCLTAKGAGVLKQVDEWTRKQVDEGTREQGRKKSALPSEILK